MLPDWIEFNGTVELVAQQWRLTAPNNEGVLLASEADVKQSGEFVLLRRGAVVDIIQEPPVGGRPASINPVGYGDSQAGTKCVGFVVICCETSRVISTGLGTWNDCPCATN